MTVASALSEAAGELDRAGIETSRLDAEVLLANAIGVSRAGLFARLREPLEAPVAASFRERVERRRRREPLAYIVGGREFWSLWFEVTAHTLVPRPETEVLVETALASIAATPAPRVLDLGTGSGCIAVCIAHERADARLTAIDVSPEALCVARRNAERHGVAARVQLCRADARSFACREPFDLVVANPPYIRRGDIEALPAEVSGFEPRAALDGGEDGLDLVGAILSRARRLLTADGALVMEIGSDQREAALALAAEAGFERAWVRPDYAGLPRLLVSAPVPDRWRGRGADPVLSAEGAR